ncbi:MAG: hypothetical protein LBQ66_04480 [Planctomycetaceae bacterium]|nr:hypothetical protein [Planctomycetaceae bacterium]
MTLTTASITPTSTTHNINNTTATSITPTSARNYTLSHRTGKAVPPDYVIECY